MEEWIVVLQPLARVQAPPPFFLSSFLLWPSASFPFLLQPLLPLLLFPLLAVSFVGSPSFACFLLWCNRWLALFVSFFIPFSAPSFLSFLLSSFVVTVARPLAVFPSLRVAAVAIT